MGRPVKLFKRFRSTFRYMQLDPTKVFSYPSVAWVRINRSKLKIVFFLDSTSQSIAVLDVHLTLFPFSSYVVQLALSVEYSSL